MTVGDGSPVVLDEWGNVVSGGSSRQRKGHPPPKVKARRSVPAAKLSKLVRDLAGLTVEHAEAHVAQAGLDVDVEFLEANLPSAPRFRYNHIRAFVENGLVVWAEPG